MTKFVATFAMQLDVDTESAQWLVEHDHLEELAEFVDAHPEEFGFGQTITVYFVHVGYKDVYEGFALKDVNEGEIVRRIQVTTGPKLAVGVYLVR